jgi:hypothetical protein
MTDDPQAPWGVFKYSGVARECDRYGIEAFLETRAILESWGGLFMRQHVTLSPSEAANPLAIREFVEAYAHCAWQFAERLLFVDWVDERALS